MSYRIFIIAYTTGIVFAFAVGRLYLIGYKADEF